MEPFLVLFIYGAAVQRDGAKQNRAAAWLDAAILPFTAAPLQPNTYL